MAAEIVLPVRLNVWNEAEPLIHKTATANGNEISSLEIQGSEGEPVYAIEDGILVVDEWDQAHNAANLVADPVEKRIWNYRHIKATVDGPVHAGDKIGYAAGPQGGNLIIGVMDDDSVKERLPSDSTARSTWEVAAEMMGSLTEGDIPGVFGDIVEGWEDFWGDDAEEETTSYQQLSRNPLQLMDDLDVMPLPEDLPSDVDTDEERHALSEQLTGRRGGFNIDTKTVFYVAGAGLAAYGFYKLVSK